MNVRVSIDAEMVRAGDELVGVGTVQLVEHLIADETVAIYIDGEASYHPRHRLMLVRREVTL